MIKVNQHCLNERNGVIVLDGEKMTRTNERHKTACWLQGGDIMVETRAESVGEIMHGVKEWAQNELKRRKKVAKEAAEALEVFQKVIEKAEI